MREIVISLSLFFVHLHRGPEICDFERVGNAKCHIDRKAFLCLLNIRVHPPTNNLATIRLRSCMSLLSAQPCFLPPSHFSISPSPAKLFFLEVFLFYALLYFSLCAYFGENVHHEHLLAGKNALKTVVFPAIPKKKEE